MMPMQEQALRDLPYSRKPNGWEAIEAVVTPSDINVAIGDEWEDILPVRFGYEVYDGEPHPLTDFKCETPTVFLLRIPCIGSMLVNTEGYTYCRYVARFKETGG